MDQEKWKKIEELFVAALELPAAGRGEFLDASCPNDDELRQEVESLLNNVEIEDSFLAKPAYSLGLTLLKNDQNHVGLGEKIGRYKIIRLIGEGGMGEVYLAEDISLNRHVALKLLPSYLVENKESVKRFQKEALAASAMSHPNIAHIYEAGVEDNRSFIAMEYVEGTTLRELLRQKKLDVITALDIILQTANALTSAHSAGIIHRDIKPENIMIRHDGYIKILDFGIAKLLESKSDDRLQRNHSTQIPQQSIETNTNPALIMGTMNYISPEQLSNKNVDLRTDIWSLGVVLYEIVTQTKPFKGKTAEETGRAIIKNDPPLPEFPTLIPEDAAKLQRIILRTLEKNPAKRYQSTSELANEVKELKQHLEFTRHFSTGEIKTEISSPNISGTFSLTQNSSFITRSKILWNNQSLSRKAIILAAAVGLLTFAIGIYFQYFNGIFLNNRNSIESFSADSRNRWQISTLFGIRRKLGGIITSVSFSPNGRAIAFSMFSEGVNNIYVKQLNKDDAVRITDGIGLFQTPVWSPDSQQIAFVSNRDNKNAIWTISPNGGTPTFKTNLTINTSHCELLKWSKNNNQIFFKSAQLLKTIDLDTGHINEIKIPVEKTGRSFSISDDETLVAFNSIKAEKQKICLYYLKTNNLVDVTNEGNFDLSPALLPDNKRLIFSSNQTGNPQLYIIDLVSKATSQLTFGDANASDPIISPDGNQVVYISETNTANIFMLEMSNQNEHRLTEATKMQLFPHLSKDGTELVFQMTDDFNNFENSQLKIKNLRTNSESALENQKGFWAKWSPLGSEISYLRTEGADTNIWKFNTTSKQTTQLTLDKVWTEGRANAPFNLTSFPFDWSPNGKKIAFVSNRSNISNVCTIDSNGENLQKLTNNENQKIKYSSPMWSPDGGKIAFSHRTETEPNKLQYAVSVIANNQLTECFRSDKKTRLIGWSSTGKNLLASVSGLNEVEIYELSGSLSESKLLTKITGADVNSFSILPDGKTIIYSASRNQIDNIFSYTLYGKEKQLTDNREDTIMFSGISWSPAGDRIFYSKQSGGLQISMISDIPEKTE